MSGKRLAILAVVCAAAISAFASDAIDLANELPVEGPQVTLQPSYGLYYRPGAAFALEGVVRPGGLVFSGGLTVQEGDPERGPRYEIPLVFQDDTPQTFRLPVRAPVGGASLKVIVWSRSEGSAHRRDLFVGSLVDVLKPVAQDERVVWQLGHLPAPHEADWKVARVTPERLPDLDWMYENVSLILLGSGGLKDASPGALAAQRRWLLGGGRLLIASMDPRTLLDAVRAGFTPVPAGVESMEEKRFEWWKQHGGLDEGDVQRDERGSLAYVSYELGFGAGVVFVQGAEPGAHGRFWSQALQSGALESPPGGPPDLRVWQEPFQYFVSGEIAPARRSRSALFAGVGAGLLLLILILAATCKTRYMAAGLALAGVALLCEMLVHFFQPPEAVVSRIAVEEIPANGRALRRTEWAYLFGAEDVAALAISGPEHGSLYSCHDSDGELQEAGTVVEGGTGPNLRFRANLPTPLPPLLRSAVVEATTPRDESETVLASADGRQKLRLPDFPAYRKAPRGAILQRANGWKARLHDPFAPEGFQTEPYRNAQSSVAEAMRDLDPHTAAVRGKALNGILRRAAQSGRDALVLFDHEPLAESAEPLVAFRGIRTEEGTRFRVVLLEVVTEGAPGP